MLVYYKKLLIYFIKSTLAIDWKRLHLCHGAVPEGRSPCRQEPIRREFQQQGGFETSF
jgi:hypothetical protein